MIGVEVGDLVVDATGRATHTSEWLLKAGFAAPRETRLEVDIGYAGCFIRPRRAPEVLGTLVTESPPHGRYRCAINVQEGGLMIATLGSRGREAPLADDYAGLLALAERLPHPAGFELMLDADPVTPVKRFRFPASVHRHYEGLERLPKGFLCIGDAICNFNPVWGQGMSVAALEVDALGRMLEDRAEGAASLDGLPAAFYAEAARIIAGPWRLAAGYDLAYDTTRGERGPEVKATRGFSRALSRLAMEDPKIRGLLSEVYHLVTPREALFTPELSARVASRIEPG